MSYICFLFYYCLYYTILTLYCQEYIVKMIFIFLTIYAKVYNVKNGGFVMKLNLKQKVDEKGLNKNQFSKLIQLGYAATCNLYEGKTERIYFDTLERICKVLECTPNDIIISDDPQIQNLLTCYSQNNNKSDTNK